ncbi:MAG: hypothetical protein WBN13_06775, partial [Robiginitalea sp.]|uniref:hypothetical protein n=1 Tax=Robiginitalea sp. TaxID=1902411 RepID=UPI003C78AB5E
MTKIFIVAGLLLGSFFIANSDYPYDGYERTGIKRLKWVEDVQSGKIESNRLRPGAFYPLSSIALNLKDRKVNLNSNGTLDTDPNLQSKVDGLFRGLNPNYSMTLLDMTPGQPLRYAEHRPTAQYQPGSVGKLVVLSAFFTGLKHVYPGDFDKRLELLRTKQIKAGKWALSDHHTVPVYDLDTEKLVKRKVRDTDVFSLFEWVDHMVSVSNNGAASVVWREALLMHIFKDKYPSLTFEEAEEYFKSNPKSELSEFAITTVNQPLRDLGITEDEWRLGKFFTSGAGSYIPGRGGSIGTPIGLIKYVLALEEGRIVDEKSSLEMKRLLYLTDRRIRYAYSHKLDSAAVYFKSGSLYSCDRKKNPNCSDYAGNVYNYMNSVAIIEHPDGTR